MMSELSKNQKQVSVLAILVVVAVLILLIKPFQTKKPPARSDYYTGPMYNYRTGSYVTEDGKIVPPPPGAKMPTRGRSNAGITNQRTGD